MQAGSKANQSITCHLYKIICGAKSESDGSMNGALGSYAAVQQTGCHT